MERSAIPLVEEDKVFFDKLKKRTAHRAVLFYVLLIQIP